MVSSIVSNENELLADINRSLDALRYHVDIIGYRNYVDQRLYLGREIDRLATAFDALTAAFSPPPEPAPSYPPAEQNDVTSHAVPSSPVPVEADDAEPFLTGRGWENLSCDDQFRLATQIAANIGYDLIAEPEHPDSPHNRAHTLPAAPGHREVGE